MSAHNSLYCGPVKYFGTHEQKLAHLAPYMDGTQIGCFGLSEPGKDEIYSFVGTWPTKLNWVIF